VGLVWVYKSWERREMLWTYFRRIVAVGRVTIFACAQAVTLYIAGVLVVECGDPRLPPAY